MFDTLRNPEYTDKNRCNACTAINALIAVGLSLAVSIVLIPMFSTLFVASVSTGLLSISIIMIWLRGYLVPRTPALTKRYMPLWMLAWFGKDTKYSDDTEEQIDIEGVLLEAGAVRSCEDIDDLCLSESFSQDWKNELSAVREDVDPRATLPELGYDTSNVQLDVEAYEDAIVIVRDNQRISNWPSKTALKIDIAASRALEKRYEKWNDIRPVIRSQVLDGLRIFLDECPDGETVTIRSETVESCCSTHEVVTAVYAESGERLVEQPVHSM